MVSRAELSADLAPLCRSVRPAEAAHRTTRDPAPPQIASVLRQGNRPPRAAIRAADLGVNRRVRDCAGLAVLWNHPHRPLGGWDAARNEPDPAAVMPSGPVVPRGERKGPS